MADEKKPSIFKKMLDVSSVYLDAQLAKAQYQIADLQKASNTDESGFDFGKAVTRDRTAYTGSQGYQEKSGALTYDYQKQMAIKSSILAAILKTRQNQVAKHSQYMPEGNKHGFRIKLKHEHEALEKIMMELYGEEEGDGAKDAVTPGDASPNKDTKSAETAKAIQKAGEVALPQDEQSGDFKPYALDPATVDQIAGMPDEPPLSEEDKIRAAKKELARRTKKKKRAIAEFLLNCGETKDRPFESKRWTFDAFLRALIWDTLCFDFMAVELVPKNAERLNGKFNIHHFYPVDGSTIRYASPELAKFKSFDAQMTADVLYPEDELVALERRDALELDEGRLAEHAYKYVQVVKGRIARAFTEDELKVGMRNPVTDIYANPYSISEMELLVALITSHLQTEYYNRSYFQQGFSAKGILHVKANLNRSKLEDLRRQWNHMVKGNRNSFQTPIMSGMDEIQWIPLIQNHDEMEFNLWLEYLIRMICAIFQIDSAEIGYALRDAGGSGGGLAGDNTQEKLLQAKDKGFIPLMRFLQDFLNSNIIDNLDSDYMLEFTGIEAESDSERVAREIQEVKYKRTVNEVREEAGLPPIRGCDSLILDPVFFQWFQTMSPEGQELQQKQQMQAQAAQPQGPEDPSHEQQWKADEAKADNQHQRDIEGKLIDGEMARNKMQKSSNLLKVEFYKVSK